MLIKSNEIYYTVESMLYETSYNRIQTYEFKEEEIAESYYKNLCDNYNRLSEEKKTKVMIRLAKVSNRQSMTLSCCGLGVIANFSINKEP